MTRLLIIAGLFASPSCAETRSATTGASTDLAPASATTKIVVVSPTRGLANYPCETCHRHADNSAGTVENAHSQIRVHHMPNGTCDTCHHPETPGTLRLASGVAVELEELHDLCGQCHSEQLADWSVGIHGKQVGNWRTEMHRFGCTKCHDPHEPAFGTMEALPAPAFPALGIPKGEH